MVKNKNQDKEKSDYFQSHNIFFSKISKFINKCNHLNEEKYIQNEDVDQFIAQNTNVQSQIEQLEEYLQQNKMEFQETKFNLLKVYLYMTGLPLLKGFILQMTNELQSALGIFLLDMITNQFKKFSQTDREKLQISLVLIAIVVNYTVKNFAHVQFEWIKFRWNALCRTTLQYLVYKKSQKVLSFSKANSEVVDEKQQNEESEQSLKNIDSISFENNNPDINNLLTTDVEGSLDMFWGINQTVGSLLVIFTTLIYIYSKVGFYVIYGVAMLLFSILFSIVMGYLISRTISKMSMFKDQRVSMSKDVVEGIKNIKFLGWENIFSQKLKELRKKEFKQISFVRILDGLQTTFFISSSYFLLYILISSFVDDGNNLSDTNVFTIIALFGNLAHPIGMIPFSIRCISKSRISFIRIQNFLNLKEINNTRVQTQITESSQSQQAILIKNGQFQWPDLERKHNLPKTDTKQTNQNYQSQSTLIKSKTSFDIFQLQIENLKVSKGTLNFVIGKIGSGKTALLLAILNEMEQISDARQSGVDKAIKCEGEKQTQVYVYGSIAYVSQNHWLQTQTIQENILFGKPYEEGLYNKCLELCCLQTDFSNFLKGDQKFVSSDGSNLSGGQRQRISLCRALYQEKDIYLLDDIFSSLDIHVAQYIFQNAIVDYLIKQKKKTVILTTSNYGFISNQYAVDFQVLYLNEGNLIQKEQDIQNYIFQTEINQIKHTENNISIKQSNVIKDKNSIQLHNDKNDFIDQSAENFLKTQGNIEHVQNSPYFEGQLKQINLKQDQEETKKFSDEEQEQKENETIKLETLMTYLKSQNLILLFLLFLSYGLVEATTLLIDSWLKDQLTFKDIQQSKFLIINQWFSSFSKTLQFLTIVQLIFTLVSQTFFVITSLLSSQRIFNRLNNAIMFSKSVFFDKTPVGHIITRLSSDMNTVDDSLPYFFIKSVTLLAYAVGYSVGISIQIPEMSIFFLQAFLISYSISKLYRCANRQIKRLNQINEGDYQSHISESCKGVVVVRSMQKQSYMIQMYIQKLSKSINTFILSLSMEMWMFVRLYTFTNIVQLIAVLRIIYSIYTEEQADQNMIIQCLSYIILFSGSICDLVNYSCMFEQELISVERIRQYFSNKQEKLDQSIQNDQILNDNDKSIEDKQYSIIFKNVSLTYEQIKQDNISSIEYALNDFSLKIKRGEKIAICGRTGSGKTSILNCLFRLYDYQQGSIFIDNQNILSMSLKQLRSKMSVIPQFGFLYNSSLRNNIDPIQEKSDQQIQDFISYVYKQSAQQEQNQYFDNLNLEIQDGGKNLSNGQKQIINFVRATLRDSEIICLDEATSNMDPSTDKLIHTKLFEISQEKTLLVITHRLENIQKYDRIIVLNQGKIVESGNYGDLIKIKGGFFNKLLLQNLSNQ
ncbi:ABC transporter C family protein (macronuclear) [Tetrahymena thermophila SB210]|uniref:ABC transporter C family protein n=1 Tax=Tetrahymena thermophila (strain SB210) TaxID=312017 RepID=I7LVI1_TETTS|nr:ABC transporter C family protein [Tetrahymena thermophila SB210]EAR98273.2 ABC transporter C family protein [Tetrahymena thermophila SB210]|eukprot:XP_001018518.2 ABC transporter C family protein [Tetrahymena thermophila SB210]